MRVCYLIQSYHMPDLLVRLARTLRRGSPDCVVCISHDERGEPLPHDALHLLDGTYVIKGVGGRGDFRWIDGLLTAVRYLFDKGVDFDWLVNLTGQDYPIMPLHESEQRLFDSCVDGFLEYFPVFSQQCPWSEERRRERYLYRYRHFNGSASHPILTQLARTNRFQSLLRVEVDFGSAIGIRTRGLFGMPFQCFGGSNYASLKVDCVRYILDFAQSNPNIIDRFRHVLLPEEIFLQSILLNSGRFTLTNDNLRYIDWTDEVDGIPRRTGSPKTLDISDLPAIRRSGKHFARKFDMKVDEQLLDSIDELVLG